MLVRILATSFLAGAIMGLAAVGLSILLIELFDNNIEYCDSYETD